MILTNFLVDKLAHVLYISDNKYIVTLGKLRQTLHYAKHIGKHKGKYYGIIGRN